MINSYVKMYFAIISIFMVIRRNRNKIHVKIYTNNFDENNTHTLKVNTHQQQFQNKMRGNNRNIYYRIQKHKFRLHNSRLNFYFFFSFNL